MAAPQGLTLKRNRDLEGLGRRPVVRATLLGVLAAVLALGLLNVFGQLPETSREAVGEAEFSLTAPKRLRSGLFYMARFTIRARQELERATVVVPPSWLDGMTLNTIEPATVGEASRDGRIAFELGHIPRGDRYEFFLHFQVNPTTVGVRTQDAELYDGERLLARLDRTLVVFP